MNLREHKQEQAGQLKKRCKLGVPTREEEMGWAPEEG
jgi:hypothetical protein